MKKIRKNISGIKDVLFEKSKRATRLNISIKPFRGIRVAIPYGVSFKQAESLFHNKIDWIKEKLKIVENVEKQRPVFGISGKIETNHHVINIINNGVDNLKIDQDEKHISLFLPAGTEINNSQIQRTIRSLLIKIYRVEAKYYLPPRVARLAQKHHFNYNKVYIKFQKTLWGSCSGKLNINLNLNLMRLKSKLRDYVILHELLHTRIRNHSEKFWSELSKYVANPRQKDACLNKYNLRYYVP